MVDLGEIVLVKTHGLHDRPTPPLAPGTLGKRLIASGLGLPVALAYMYDYINFAHPFREGNGRTQREFFDQLLSESGRGLAWNLIDKTELHNACHVARADGDPEPLQTLFSRIVDDEPGYFF